MGKYVALPGVRTWYEELGEVSHWFSCTVGFVRTKHGRRSRRGWLYGSACTCGNDERTGTHLT